MSYSELELKQIQNAYRGLLRSVKTERTPQDNALLRKAFNISLEAHKDMRRKSGEPYIYHPIAVARICAEEMELDVTSIVSALLHDTVEDTHITLEDINDLFGQTVRNIIDGLTKIPETFDPQVSLQAENFRKMILTISDDLRVVLVKLADRLHNMRTLGSMRRDKQLKISYETQFLYAPLAHRLGLNNIKTELEDLSLKYKKPHIYEEIETKLERSKEVRQRFIRQFSLPIKKALDETGIDYTIKARTKAISSIYRKMVNKDIDVDEIYDIFAIRIIIHAPEDKEKQECWRVYSLVTDFYQPNPDRLRDWISIPKANGYESLHTTVMSPTGKWVEVQIRSERMDALAEKGLAAHWKYKEGGSKANKFERWLTEVRGLMENHQQLSTEELVDEFKSNLFNDEIYVFTPKGDLRVLPHGSSTLDFAYDIHSNVGNTCIGAKVNSKLVPLSHKLKSGDQIEIITSSKQKPKSDWLNMVSSGKARQRIRQALKEEKRVVGRDGQEILERKLQHLKIPSTDKNIVFLVKNFGFKSHLDFYFAIAKGRVNLDHIKDFELNKGVLSRKEEQKKKEFTEIIEDVNSKKDEIIIGGDFKNIEYTLAKCCHPIPGDNVFGFITSTQGIKIHRDTCSNAEQLLSNYAYRVIKARWKSQENEQRLVNLSFTGIDSVGIVNDITKIVSDDHQVNMKSISFDSTDGIFHGSVQLYVYDVDHLDTLLSNLRNIGSIKSVDRVTMVDDGSNLYH